MSLCESGVEISAALRKEARSAVSPHSTVRGGRAGTVLTSVSTLSDCRCTLGAQLPEPHSPPDPALPPSAGACGRRMSYLSVTSMSFLPSSNREAGRQWPLLSLSSPGVPGCSVLGSQSRLLSRPLSARWCLCVFSRRGTTIDPGPRQLWGTLIKGVHIGGPRTILVPAQIG